MVTKYNKEKDVTDSKNISHKVKPLFLQLLQLGYSIFFHTGVWKAIFGFIFGPEKTVGWHQKSPLGNQFSRYDPSGKLTPTGSNHHNPSGKLVLSP